VSHNLQNVNQNFVLLFRLALTEALPVALVEGEHFVVDAGLLGAALGALLATLTRAVGVSAVVDRSHVAQPA
jgi:hypothetical protein